MERWLNSPDGTNAWALTNSITTEFEARHTISPAVRRTHHHNQQSMDLPQPDIVCGSFCHGDSRSIAFRVAAFSHVHSVIRKTRENSRM